MVSSSVYDQLVSRAGRAAALHLASFDVGFADLLERQVAHVNAIAIEDALLVFLLGRRLALKRLGPIIGLDSQRTEPGSRREIGTAFSPRSPASTR